MDQFFVEYLLLNPFLMIGTNLLLTLIGGVVGAYFFTVRVRFRRVSYLWFLAGSNLALMIFQRGGGAFIPSAATAGLLSVLIIGLLSSFLFFGAALYYGSAARSNDIIGNTGKAWLGFVPLANLWLVFKRGHIIHNLDIKQRSAFTRFFADPLLVISALVVLTSIQVLGKVRQDSPIYQVSDSEALVALVANAQTLEESFAAEAAASSRELPIRIDEFTVFSAIEANGKTLRITFDVEQDFTSLSPAFKHALATQNCAPDMFAHDIRRGGRIILAYRGPDGQIIEEFEISRLNCP